MRFEGVFATLLVLCAISYLPGSLQRGAEGNVDTHMSVGQLNDDGWYEQLLNGEPKAETSDPSESTTSDSGETTTEDPDVSTPPDTDSAFSPGGSSLLTVGAILVTLVVSWGR
ncbi:uncharacterized protein LOC126198838 [Schistocerca nitens]|uniref:uncharacterized protein LOC126198838 n=1 Tax=Schistocerca nitens TaxID=7011 RepID=UPI0021196309|nr:uncharacterized protein LOC126198838 [Schistocerca nitens]